MNSPFLALHLNDFVKGFVIAVLIPVVTYVGQVITGGGFTMDWGTIWHLALVGGIAYLSKNLVTNSQGSLLTTEPKV